LKQFEKLHDLKAGETRHVKMDLVARDFSFWNVNTHSWQVEPGTYTIMVGSSSRDLPLVYKLDVTL